MSELEISPIQKKDLEKAAFVVSKSFLTKPADHIKAVWKGSETSIFQQNQNLFKLLFRLKGKEVYVVKEQDEIIAVYAIQHSRYRHMSLFQKAKILFPMLKAVGENLPRLIHWQDQWGSLEPEEEHIHLSPMCVLPEAQGKGIGKLMLQHFCEILDQRQLGGYLETGKWENVLFYQHYGFSIRDETKIYSANTWTMWRDALSL